ncbi:MAG: hypothetical protein AABZ53_13670 [Planctomycetota bacterium]
MSTLPELAVRQTQRHDVALKGQVAIAPEHAGLVRLAQSAGGKDGWIDVDVVDLSVGGLALLSPVFIPRHVMAIVRILGSESGTVLLETPATVQRVVMTDRRPMYLVGFHVTPTPESSVQMNQLLKRLGDEGVT